MAEYFDLVTKKEDPLFPPRVSQQFTIIDDKKIIVDMREHNTITKVVLMQFETNREAETWLVEHFDKMDTPDDIYH